MIGSNRCSISGVRGAGIAAVLALGACRATPAYQGTDGGVLATYQVRRLTADLPAEVRVPAVIAAARATLMQRGYAIQSESATEDEGNISGVPPDPGLMESVEVLVKHAATGTHIRIIAQPLGNQARSRAILDGVLANLGW